MIDKHMVVAELQALAHEARLEVFLILMAAGPGGLAAGALGERVSMSPSALSFHLTRLRHAGLVTARRNGQHILYSACFERMDDLLGFLTEHCCRDSAKRCGSSCGGRKRVPNPRRERPSTLTDSDEPVSTTTVEEAE